MNWPTALIVALMAFIGFCGLYSLIDLWMAHRCNRDKRIPRSKIDAAYRTKQFAVMTDVKDRQ